MSSRTNTAVLSRNWLLRASLALVLGLCAGLAPATAASLNMVSVGVSDFKNNYQGKLESAHKDAIGVKKMFQAQKGKLFTNVSIKQLINEEATAANIVKGLQGLRIKANADTYTLLFVASHGGTDNVGYFFCAHDQIVDWSDIKAALGGLPGKVIVILDTCGAGGVKQADNLIVFSACLSGQASGENDTHGYFTQAFLAGLGGKADQNKDGKVTLAELDAYVANQLEKFNQGKKPNEFQQCTLLRPPDVPSSLPLALGTYIPVAPKSLAGTSWKGEETLAGFGKLLFVFDSGNKASMTDAQNGNYNGTWTQDGDKVTISMPDINTTYTGTMDGPTVSGQGKDNNNGEWNFKVKKIKSLANSTWEGQETLAGFGKLSFVFATGGKASMTDAQNGNYNGTWSQQGDKVTISVPDISTTYTGTLDGATVTGQGKDNDNGTWNFNVSRVKSLANTAWEGQETLTGFGKLTFGFEPGGKATMTDAQNGNYTGTWTQEGSKVTITIPDISTTYTGTLEGASISGQGKDNQNGTWNFNLGWAN